MKPSRAPIKITKTKTGASIARPLGSMPALLLTSLICIAALGVQEADAKTIDVHIGADGGPGSLRQAIAQVANGDKINIDVKGGITLTSGELLINKSITLHGNDGHGTISGNNTSRVFHITPETTVMIDGLVIVNGRASSDPNDFPANFGGGIYSDHATLTIRNCVISNNLASQGGGIYSNGEGPGSATLRVTDCTFSGNSAGLVGGAINNDGENGSAVLSITGSTLSNNIAGCDSGDFLKGGSGIFNDGSFSGSATANVTRCMISDNGNPNCGDSTRYGGGITNIAFSGNSSLTLTETTVMRNQANYGGGLFNYSDSGSAQFRVNGCTIGPSNYADGAGGGIYNDGFNSSSQISNSTISGNQCGFGAAILNGSNGTLTLNSDTLSDNTGIGIWNFGGMEIGNSIFRVADFHYRNFDSFFGAITSHGYNLCSDPADGDGSTAPGGVLNGPGDIRNVDPLLGLLQDNGGPTLTHALLPNSPAINAGDPNFTASGFNPPLLYDQRGSSYPRVNNGRIDIGAFEWMTGQKYAGSQIKTEVTDVGPELGESASLTGFIINRRDTNQILLPGLGAIFKSRNGGDTWSAMGPIASNGFRDAPSVVRQDPVTSQVVFLRGISGVFYRSADFGESWTPFSALPDFDSMYDFAFLPATPNVILALVGNEQDNVLWRSENGGTTFNLETNTGLPAAQFDPVTSDLISDPHYSDIATTPADPNAVYVTLSDDRVSGQFGTGGYVTPAIYKSMDGGRTFAPLAASPPGPIRVFPHPTNANVIFVGTILDPIGSKIFRSLNGGASFDVIPINLPTGRFVSSVVFDPRNPSTLYVTGTAGAFRSTDFGRSFQPLGLTAAQLAGADGVTALSVDPKNPSLIYVNTDRGNFKSTDAGKTFRSISNGWKNALVYDITFDAAPDPTLYLGLGGGNGVIRTRDRGKNFERIADPLDPTDFDSRVRSFAFSRTQPNLIFAGTLNAGLFRSLDRGKSWTQSNVDTGNVGFRRQDSDVAVDPNNPNNVYFATTDIFSVDISQGFYRSTDGGANFHLTLDAGLTAMAIDPVHPNVLYACDRFGQTSNLLKSTDGGLTFTALAGLNGDQVIVDPSNPNIVYVREGAELLRSNNGGTTFLPAGIGLPVIVDVVMDPQNPTRLYALTQGGLFMTTDQGASWTLVEGDETVKALPRALAVNPKNPNLIYVANFSVLEIEIHDH